MGRTLLPYSHGLESEQDRWRPFRPALSKEDQQAFDRLFDRAKFHTASASLFALVTMPVLLFSGIAEKDCADSGMTIANKRMTSPRTDVTFEGVIETSLLSYFGISLSLSTRSYPSFKNSILRHWSFTKKP